MTCPVMGRAQPELTLSEKHKTGPGVPCICCNFNSAVVVPLVLFACQTSVKETQLRDSVPKETISPAGLSTIPLGRLVDQSWKGLVGYDSILSTF